MRIQTGEVDADDGISKKAVVAVLIHGNIVSYKNGRSTSYAKERAAKAALDVLGVIATPKEFREKFK